MRPIIENRWQTQCFSNKKDEIFLRYCILHFLPTSPWCNCNREKRNGVVNLCNTNIFLSKSYNQLNFRWVLLEIPSAAFSQAGCILSPNQINKSETGSMQPKCIATPSTQVNSYTKVQRAAYHLVHFYRILGPTVNLYLVHQLIIWCNGFSAVYKSHNFWLTPGTMIH